MYKEVFRKVTQVPKEIKGLEGHAWHSGTRDYISFLGVEQE